VKVICNGGWASLTHPPRVLRDDGKKGPDSHGVCEECMMVALAEAEKLQKEKKADDHHA